MHLTKPKQSSFKQTVDSVSQKVEGTSGRQFLTDINGWEIGIDVDTATIYHALYKGGN